VTILLNLVLVSYCTILLELAQDSYDRVKSYCILLGGKISIHPTPYIIQRERQKTACTPPTHVWTAAAETRSISPWERQ